MKADLNVVVARGGAAMQGFAGSRQWRENRMLSGHPETSRLRSSSTRWSGRSSVACLSPRWRQTLRGLSTR
eukprot:8462512-Lingulodinium_polyedra.AAC.1